MAGLAVALLILSGCVAPPDYSGPSRLADAGRYPEAIRAYEQMREGLGAEARSTVDTQIAALRVRYTDQVLAEAGQQLAGGETLPRLRAAIATIASATAYDDRGNRLAAERDRLTKRAEAVQAKQAALAAAAAERAAARDWQGAIDQLLAYQKLVGELTDAQKADLQRWLNSRDDAKAASVHALILKRDDAGAEAELKALGTLTPAVRPALATALAAELTSLRQVLFIEAQQALIAEKHYYPAYRNLAKADFPAARELLAQVRTVGGAYYRSVAQSELDTDLRRLGYAYFAATKSKELNPDDPETFKLQRTISDAIDEFITTRIAVAGFDSPATFPGMGAQVSDALITYLIDHLPYGIKIMERSQVDQILSGRGNALESIGKQLGLEVVIVGNVSSFSVERKRTEGQVTEIVTVGTRKESNPEYTQLVSQYGNNQAKWPSQPPAFIEVPERQTVSYRRGEETLTGVMVAYVRSFETAKGLITQSREFTSGANHKDSFRDAVPAANIEFDPLDLPSDNTVREAMRADLVKQIAGDALKRYEKREARYLRDADLYLQRREKDTAVLQLAGGHYYITVATDAVAADVAKRIDQLGMLELTE
jgi:hypothetical protein